MSTKLTGTGAQVTADHTTDAGTKASVTINATDNPADLATLTIEQATGTKTYTFRTSLSGHQDDDSAVLIGVSGTATCENLAAAMTLGDGAGTTYSTGTTALTGLDVTADTDLILLENTVPGIPTEAQQIAIACSDGFTVTDESLVDGVEPGCIVTSSPHGLSTGDGPLSLVGSEGAWTLLDFTNGLYYVIVVDATSFRLAPSPYDAVLGNYFTLHRTVIQLGDVIKYRFAAESDVHIFEQLRKGWTSEKLEAATDIDPS